MKLKRILAVLTAGLFTLVMAAAMAQPLENSGALTLNQLESWGRTLVAQAAQQQPLNAPVGEESFTQDGYAFLYDAYTLYFEKPSVDSRLMAVALTETGVTDPRQIAVGDDQSALLGAYGWQNPGLIGDGTFAALYLENELPADARWAWAIYWMRS